MAGMPARGNRGPETIEIRNDRISKIANLRMSPAAFASSFGWNRVIQESVIQEPVIRETGALTEAAHADRRRARKARSPYVFEEGSPRLHLHRAITLLSTHRGRNFVKTQGRQ